MLSLNERALAIVQAMIDEAEALELKVTRLGNGTPLVDAGVKVAGSFEAGRLFAEACMSGLGKVSFRETGYGELSFPSVSVSAGRPVLACMASQYAGWAVHVEKTASTEAYSAMGSGPARALFLGEKLFQKLAYRDRSEVALAQGQARREDRASVPHRQRNRLRCPQGHLSPVPKVCRHQRPHCRSWRSCCVCVPDR